MQIERLPALFLLLSAMAPALLGLAAAALTVGTTSAVLAAWSRRP